MENRMDVFAKKTKFGEITWAKAGTAFLNMDGSVSVYLDVLPIEGVLKLQKEEKEQHD